MRTGIVVGLLLLGACQSAAVSTGPSQPAAPMSGLPAAASDPTTSRPVLAPVPSPGATAQHQLMAPQVADTPYDAARFRVPPLPPGSPIQRWQQFCWVGAEALAHLDDAGAQGWELVSVVKVRQRLG